MTVVAFVQPDRTAPPSTAQSWAEFVSESLDLHWRPEEWDPRQCLFEGVLNSPRTGIAVCVREGCEMIVDVSTSLCSGCRKARRRCPAGTPLPPREPHLPDSDLRLASRFSLMALAPGLRDEILFGLQDRDRQNLAIRPSFVRDLVDKIPADTSHLLDLKDTDFRGMTRSLLRSLQQAVNRLDMLYRGADGMEGDVWDCALIGLVAKRDRNYTAVTGRLDFTVIRQEWLRDLTKQVLRSLRPNVATCQRYIQAAHIASSVLAGRPNGSTPTKLSAGDMSAICQALVKATDPITGAAYSESHRRSILGWWRRLTEYARNGGLMDDVPGTFVVRPDQMAGPYSDSEDVLGRAVPEEWIAYLDSNLHRLGSTSSFAPAGWDAEDLREMYRTYYLVMRDTGRRPSEVARLADDPVEWIRDVPSLVYDNRKSGRNRRRLPIDKSTAAIIETWRKRLDSLHIVPACEGYLFPAPGAQKRERRGHLDSSQFRKVFKAWAQILPPPTGFSETAAAISAEDLELYGFRHAYAQRHADNGTPIDVLRDLMDHKEIETTMGYYKVTLTPKQKAVSIVSQMAVDRAGSAAPFPTGVSYERSSVATAYGNCTEPTNVKAGGKNCPIRFQCSGCSFYRPDPSYLAAIEQQIAQLRADRAIALTTDAAKWVIENLDAQINSYEEITKTMSGQLEALPDAEKEAITTACTDLRKARQVALIPVEDLHRRPGDSS